MKNVWRSCFLYMVCFLVLGAAGILQAASWSLLLDGQYGNNNFGSDQKAGAFQISRTNDKRRIIWGKYEHVKKFDLEADGIGLGTSFPISLPRSALAFAATAAPNQDIIPLTTAETSLIHDPTGWLEAVLRFRYAHYDINNIYMTNPTVIWMPHRQLQWSVSYYWTMTDFLGGGETVPDHSVSTRLLVRPIPHFYPWVAYSHSEEAFEAGSQNAAHFSAHHYVGGIQIPINEWLELHPSFEYESRSNHQILRVGNCVLTMKF